MKISTFYIYMSFFSRQEVKAEIKQLQKELYGKKKTDIKEQEEQREEQHAGPDAVQEFMKEKEK